MGHLISHPCFPTFQSPPLKLTISALRPCSHSDSRPAPGKSTIEIYIVIPIHFLSGRCALRGLVGGLVTHDTPVVRWRSSFKGPPSMSDNTKEALDRRDFIFASMATAGSSAA